MRQRDKVKQSLKKKDLRRQIIEMQPLASTFLLVRIITAASKRLRSVQNNIDSFTIRLSRRILAPRITTEILKHGIQRDQSKAQRDSDLEPSEGLNALMNSVLGSKDPLLSKVVNWVAAEPLERYSHLNPVLNRLVNSGYQYEASQIALAMMADTLGETDISRAHHHALLAERFELAESLEHLLEGLKPDNSIPHDGLLVDRMMKLARPLDAITALERSKPLMTSSMSRRYLDALNSIGAYSEILNFLSSTSHSLPLQEELLWKFRSCYAQGELTDAFEMLWPLLTETIPPREVVSALALLLTHISGRVEDQLSLRLNLYRDSAQHPGSPREITRALQFFEVMNDIDSLATLADTFRGEQIDEMSRYTIAMLDYADGAFGDALAGLDRITGEAHSLRVAWLRARIEFEQGNDNATIFPSKAARTDDGLDEVQFFGDLNRGRLERAFSNYCSVRDQRRFRSVFGSRSEFGGELPFVDQRAVVAQNGPGDEIQISSLFASLAETCNHLVITCDPRLEVIFAQMFPQIEFVACPRISGVLVPGVASTAEPARARNALYDLISEEARSRICHADKVLPMRSLPLFSLRLEKSSWPLSRLAVSPSEVASGRSHQKRVGVLWRSEFVSLVRKAQYFRPSDMSVLLSEDYDFVCLQYDITDEERAELLEVAQGRMTFVDHVDLRNDFVSAVNLLQGLDAVVGPGTTLVELSGALGIPTVLVLPTRFGRWRASDSSHTDYWFSSIRVASLDCRADMHDLFGLVVEVLEDHPGLTRS